MVNKFLLMKTIDCIIVPVANGVDLVASLLETEFKINPTNSKDYARSAKPYFDALKDTCFLVAEFPYVDRVYRDSYYTYFSSKSRSYQKDCARISIFECAVTIDDLRNPARIAELKNQYRGFIILRPTIPFIIGRNTISPKALKSNNFRICATTIHSTVNSVKFDVDGFPHSSQDTETISCAETTVWSIMEYFGTKYPDYKPVSPSKITDVIGKITTERQIPSKGLNIEQMSFALKEFGFGTRIYSESSYRGDFKKLFSSYIESGIPLIVQIDNHGVGNIGHAVLCIGYEEMTATPGLIDAIRDNQFAPSNALTALTSRSVKIYDWDDIEKSFVFIDDNRPPYQKASFDNPAIHYTPNWHTCKIKSFVAPLHARVYLEAFEAKKYVVNYLAFGYQPLASNSEVLIRLYLTSSRSYKDGLVLNDTFDSTIKKLILNLPMAKFIWVAELSDKTNIKNKKATGLMILDGTEANIYNQMMLFTAYQGEINIFGGDLGIPAKYSITLPPFDIYENNLKKL